VEPRGPNIPDRNVINRGGLCEEEMKCIIVCSKLEREHDRCYTFCQVCTKIFDPKVQKYDGCGDKFYL
jgi:hypothetical protein